MLQLSISLKVSHPYVCQVSLPISCILVLFQVQMSENMVVFAQIASALSVSSLHLNIMINPEWSILISVSKVDGSLYVPNIKFQLIIVGISVQDLFDMNFYNTCQKAPSSIYGMAYYDSPLNRWHHRNSPSNHNICQQITCA